MNHYRQPARTCPSCLDSHPGEPCTRRATVVKGATLIPFGSNLLSGGVLSRADTESISTLFQRHGPAVYRRACRLLGNSADAEEATQEIFIRVMKGADGFRQQSQLTTWLYQITTNYCLNQMRDRSRRAELHREHLDKPEGTEESVPANSADLVLLRKLLSQADEQQAKAVVYVFLDGMSHQEAAEVLGVSKRTVGNLVERFREWAQAQEEAGPLSASRSKS